MYASMIHTFFSNNISYVLFKVFTIGIVCVEGRRVSSDDADDYHSGHHKYIYLIYHM